MPSRPTALSKRIEALRKTTAKLELLPPLTSAKLAALESKLGVELDEAHRAFLTQVAAGEAATGGIPLLTPEQGVKELPKGAKPSKPSPLPVPKGKSKKPLDVGWDGVLPLRDHGDAAYDVVVVSGPARGTVWHAFDEGFVAIPGTVLDLIEAHFEEALDGGDDDDDGDEDGDAQPKAALGVFPEKMLRNKAAKELVVGSLGLTALPDEIGQLTELRSIILDGNPLRALPDAIGKLKKLEVLGAGSTELAELTPAVGALAALTRLDLAQTKLTRLPDEVGQLTRLRELDVRGTALTALPSLERLTALETLRIERTPLKRLPDGLEKTALKELSLEELPNLDIDAAIAVAAGIPSLRILRIRALKPRSFAKLEALTQLTTLRLIRLELGEVPASVLKLGKLETLSLDQNELVALPDALGELPKLKTVVLFSNPMSKPEAQKYRARWPHLTLSI